MPSPDEQGRPAVLVVLWPCDRLDDDAGRRAAREYDLALARARGWHVVDEATVPACPRHERHDEHSAAAEAALHRVRSLMAAADDRTLLLTPPDADRLPDELWCAFLLDLLLVPRIEILDADGDWPRPRIARHLLGDDAEPPGAQHPGGPADGQPIVGRIANGGDTGSDEADVPDFLPAGREPLSSYHPRIIPDALPDVVLSAPPPRVGTNAAYPASPGEPPEPQPPVAGRTGPLPHDGLFVRRNNAFGTRPTLGIADLIDQGVLIDQTRIRFDDFVASNTDGIPVPEPGGAVAVSHGSTAVPGSFKAHDETTHLVEIALRAGSQAPPDQPAGEPLAVNFVFAVDVSWSMSGEKLDDAILAIRELYAQLRDTDVLGIIVFSDQARTLLRATRKADLPADRLGRLVAGLRAQGGTDLNLGLSFAFDEIGRHSAPGTVNCVYLFSDGDPTSGETNWVTIRANVAARVRGDVTLSCFGFGSDARVPELRALAGVSGGHWTFVTKASDVTSTLSEDLARRDSLAAINIQLRIDIPAETTVWHIYGHDLVTDPAGRTAIHAEAAAARQRSRDEYRVENLPDLIRDERGIRIFAPDLAYGETYWVVLELQLPDGPAEGAIGGATVQYLDTLARDNRRIEVDLSGPGAIPAETVLTHGIGLWTSEVTFYALDDLYDNDKEAATRRLQQHVQTLKAAYAAVPAAQFRDDGITLGKLVSLAGNLGTRQVSFEGPGARGALLGYTVYTMNEFGRVRGGYLTRRGFAPR